MTLAYSWTRSASYNAGAPIAYDVISIVVTAAVSFFGGKRLSNAQANKLFTEEEIDRKSVV